MRNAVGSGVLVLFMMSACRDRDTAPAAKNEEFCKLLEQQYAQMSTAQSTGVFADPAKRNAYFTEQKTMNAKILAAAPAAVKADATLQTTNANAAYDAQLSGDRQRTVSANAALRSKENLDASQRMRDYCGIKTPAPSGT